MSDYCPFSGMASNVGPGCSTTSSDVAVDLYCTEANKGLRFPEQDRHLIDGGVYGHVWLSRLNFLWLEYMVRRKGDRSYSPIARIWEQKYKDISLSVYTHDFQCGYIAEH
ncbi:hypothetical protein HBH56_041560 [Parastagonospora nodorum]|uniref:Uncharacterized protein n=1 Tax=Phaeosphaeria nodorum (strain SN15 / ATCC MYA-4574 / FGSC 10173) TaxID=321614 RepID=A0A7U2EW56_PHANO|nr:hypothetical protein HBH56_041560 [Parastagonospora nodorum]QRC93003.1 hypothetical protein JI435_403250 [Parastagonospora nodorum SN15]KAH3933364.1 hypothetical protein HBH54_069310 [Parastagonospora nodorum]KAH3943510.1 hypothetical protein HBH53_173480 [Parastagonospora nodorum]KAH3961890.1 hypothetical protein HBH52_228660 [Parastagonospora nodorum]